MTLSDRSRRISTLCTANKKKRGRAETIPKVPKRHPGGDRKRPEAGVVEGPRAYRRVPRGLTPETSPGGSSRQPDRGESQSRVGPTQREDEYYYLGLSQREIQNNNKLLGPYKTG